MMHPFTVTCPSCGGTRTLKARDARKAQAAAAAHKCRTCGAREAWENPTEKQLRAAQEQARRMGHANAGRVASPETRAKLAQKRAGRKPALGHVRSEECRKRHSEMMTGRTHSPESREKMRERMHARYGTVHNPNRATRRELGAWAHAVIRRDHGRCVLCGVAKTTKKSIAAHHILSRSKHPDRALSIDNGVTLCVRCHADEHSINGNI